MEASLAHRLRTVVGIPLLVVALVAGGSTGLAGLQLTPVAEAPAAAPERPVQGVQAERADAPDRAPQLDAVESGPSWTPDPVADRLQSRGVVSPAWLAERAAAFAASQPVVEERAPKAPAPSKAKQPAATTSATPSRPREFTGRNRFWMPGLGMERKVYDFPCSRTRPPDHYLYRWWCAGENNVYIMGHAASVMKPLHDAYVRDRLRVGMAAYYANPKGKVIKYRVTEWRVVRPEDSGWAIASQPVPSMTLQTCVGKNDEFRLLVRLVAVNSL